MTLPTPDGRHEPASAESQTKKKRYEKPQFIREQLFETMALACGKTNSSIGQCKANHKSS
jgi:hypothetical protein